MALVVMLSLAAGQTGALQGRVSASPGGWREQSSAGQPGDELPRRAGRAEPAGDRCDRGPERSWFLIVLPVPDATSGR